MTTYPHLQILYLLNTTDLPKLTRGMSIDLKCNFMSILRRCPKCKNTIFNDEILHIPGFRIVGVQYS